MIENYKEINKWLKEHCGVNPMGDPMFRLAWSEDLREIRKGTFRDFKGDLFIREVTEARVVKKYNYLKDVWILEKWFPQHLVKNEETPNVTNGDYEAFFVFHDKFGNPLEPNLKVIEFIFYCTMRHKASTEQEIINELKIKEDQEIQTFMDLIDTSEIGNALRLKEAVGYSGAIKGDYKQ